MSAMNRIDGASKIRKACDLCYRRRIKCDGIEPRCSQCVIYGSECTHGAPRRRKRPIKTLGNSSPFLLSASGQSLGDAIASQQPTLQDALQTLDMQRQGTSSMAQCTGVGGARLSAVSIEDTTKSTQKTLGALDLPPMDVVQTLVGIYLTTYNNVLPLYDPSVLSELVNRWYYSPSQRDSVSWASINIAMALAQLQSVRGDVDSAGFTIDVCLTNAQSVLTEIMMGKLGLDSVQVVLGLVMLFQGTPDLRPALMLMSTALRLAHILGIHRKEHYFGVHPSEAFQRKRVFWIAYILDRDISLRCRQAPMQQDTDTDLEFPLHGPIPAVAEPISMPEDQGPFSAFQAHVQMAQIQSLVYDCLFSVQGRRMAFSETEKATRNICLLIRNWKSRIPNHWSAEALCQDHVTTYPRFFCTLYSRMVTCLGQLSYVNSMDLSWIENLLSHARLTGKGLPNVPPPSPQGWSLLIEECRSFMALFMSIQRKDSAFTWTNLCPYASGLLCLSANSLCIVGHNSESDDKFITAEAVAFLTRLQEKTDHDILEKSIKVYRDLEWHRACMAADTGCISS